MATVQLVLWSHRPRKSDGKVQILLRITHNRKPSYETLAYINEKHWNEKGGRVTTYDPRAFEINSKLSSRRLEVEELVAFYEGNQFEFTGQEILSIDYEKWKQDQKKKQGEPVKPKSDKTHFLFYHIQINHLLRLAGKGRLADRYDLQADIFRLFLKTKGKTDIMISKMDDKFIMEYFAWCRTKRKNDREAKERFRTYLVPNKNSTLLLRLKFINRVINHAHTKGVISSRPFATRDITLLVKAEKTTKAKLSREEIIALEELDLSSQPSLDVTRNTWLLQFYLYGTRISDMLNLRNGWIVPGEDWSVVVIQFIQMKSDQRFGIRVENPKAIAIIKRYYNPTDPDSHLLPWIKRGHDPLLNDAENLRLLESEIESRTNLINKRIKKVASLAGIEQSLSTHVTRHSVAYQAQKNKIPLEALQKAFRHSTLGMTAVYMKELSSDEVADAMKGIYES